ncbi:tripartite tricarboxylate transporter substrate binding protein [Roseomonas sp. HF4]|uniref:Bug family tripartite tricarboxylate transporter substrate binding protein n=1 Tax=Roseomonas sp. HF4 TaxID=2562313 RepID=UPI0010C0FD64|nr:tripartite tricarboxylate transporter substrate-binding protein [Roseomonas sp. HF4]
MTPTRRTAMLAAAAFVAPAVARAQPRWPDRPVTLVNPYAPGGSTDFSTRLVAARMEAVLGQSVVVEARPGAGTAVANAHVAAQRPDGYTLLMGTTSLAVLPALQPASQPRDPVAAFAPCGPATKSYFVLHVHPDLPARTTAELIAYARANPGKLSWGSSGTGAINHMSFELFRAQTRIDAVHVPYRGGAPALIDLQAGRIQAMFSATQEAGPSMEAGKTRGIAVTAPRAIARLPNLPPIADAVPGYETVFWQGVFAPAGTPAPVVAQIEAALKAATADAGVIERLAGAGIETWPGDAATLRTTLARDVETWTRIIREANIQA